MQGDTSENDGAVKVSFHLEQRKVDDGAAWPPTPCERLWATDLGSGRYKLRNIPFYAKGVNLDDVVLVEATREGLIFKSVVERHGHSTFRVLLREGRSLFEKPVIEILEAVNRCGSWYETADGTLVAIDVPPTTRLDSVFGVLELGEEWGLWDVEVGSCHDPRN